MDIQTNYIQTTKMARYSTYGQISPKTKYFWMVLHGSNMLCEQMLYKFSDFDPEEHFVIAPEALSRFYKDRFGGDVLAAWMTRRDRLQEIADIATYLTALWEMHVSQVASSCRRIAMGFSQGGTMLYRWLHAAPISLDFTICYSGWIPEDIDLNQAKTDWADVAQLFTYGESDHLLTQERMTQVSDIIKRNQLNLTIEPYDGEHRVSRDQLYSLWEKYFKMPD
ncbi:MAG: dienelactone hydrolase family protein [Bacteroidota bacterium]